MKLIAKWQDNRGFGGVQTYRLSSDGALKGAAVYALERLSKDRMGAERWDEVSVIKSDLTGERLANDANAHLAVGMDILSRTVEELAAKVATLEAKANLSYTGVASGMGGVTFGSGMGGSNGSFSTIPSGRGGTTMTPAMSAMFGTDETETP